MLPTIAQFSGCFRSAELIIGELALESLTRAHENHAQNNKHERDGYEILHVPGDN